MDVMALLHASDPLLRRNAPPTRKELFDRHRREAERETPSLAAASAAGHFDFFSRLGVEAEVERSLSCTPGSMLPMVERLPGRGATPANVSFRSVGYASPPVQPYARQSKTIYRSQLAAREQRRQVRPRRTPPVDAFTAPVLPAPSKSASSLSLPWEMLPTNQRRQQPRRRQNSDLAPFYQGILELHEKAVLRAKREHANGRGSSSAVLYDRAKLRSRKERRRQQVERWCSDADASIAAVLERERRRLETIR